MSFHTVDGSEIQLTSCYDMESLSHYKVLYIPGGDLENF